MMYCDLQTPRTQLGTYSPITCSLVAPLHHGGVRWTKSVAREVLEMYFRNAKLFKWKFKKMTVLQEK